MKRNSVLQTKSGRETICIRDIGYQKGHFSEDVRKYANGLLNSHGGVIYFGVAPDGSIIGREVTRKEEDAYRLAVDHTFGKMQPFVSSAHYRLTFIPVDNGKLSIIELKVSVGELGEIYEDGCSKVYLVDSSRLIGPLFPQELKELILLKYKESIEGAEEAAKFCTPNLAAIRATAKLKAETPKVLTKPSYHFSGDSTRPRINKKKPLEKIKEMKEPNESDKKSFNAHVSDKPKVNSTNTVITGNTRKVITYHDDDLF